MQRTDQEFQISKESWRTDPVRCYACGWKGSEKNLDHVFEQNGALSEENYLRQAESRYLGAYCPDCHERLIFECLECSWHGTTPADGPEGFPKCPECGTRNVSLQVTETTWQVFRQSVAVSAQLGFDFAS